MKKKLALLLTLALTVSALTACGQKNDTPAASGSGAASGEGAGASSASVIVSASDLICAIIAGLERILSSLELKSPFIPYRLRPAFSK